MIPIRNTVPSRYPPVITWMLIATNCLVFLLQNSPSPYEFILFLNQFALIPARYSEFISPVTICADRGNLGARRRTFGSSAIRLDAPVGRAPPIGMSGSHSDTAPAKSGLYWFFVFDFLQTTAGKDGTIETKALDVP